MTQPRIDRVAGVACAIAAAIITVSCGSTTPTGPSPASAGPATSGSGTTPSPAEPAPDPGSAPSPTPPSPAPPPAVPVVLVGAGDIGVCGSDGQRQTALLLDSIDGIVFTAGDNAYSNGTPQEFATCYDPWWGRHRSRTRPTPGNHDYGTPGATGYFDYFGAAAGPYGRGYYSFTAGAWLIVSLNSNVPAGAGSAQLAWLRAELTAHPATCVAAIWHHPLASSGPHGNNPHMREAWRTLMEFNADVVITGHDHIYERFTPLDADAYPSANGIREFVAGTGGAAPYAIDQIKAGSETHASAWGVLELTLRSDSYDWEFVPVAGGSYRDAGSAACR